MNENDWLSYMKDHYLPFCRHYGFYRELQKKIILLIKKHRAAPIVAADLGSGPGIFIDGLLKNFPSLHEIYGYEKIAGLAGIGLKKLPFLRKGRDCVSFFEGTDITKPLAIPKACDLILNINVLYIESGVGRNQIILNIKNNLKAGGIALIATVMQAWNLYKTDGSLAGDELLYNFILKPWRVPVHLFPLLKHASAVKKYNDSLASFLSPWEVRSLLEGNGFKIMEMDTYYTPRKFRKYGLGSAGGVMYLIKKTAA